MASKVKTSEKAKPFVFRGFVRCELNRSEEEDYKQWSNATTETDVYQLILQLADSGYKFSVGENPRGMGAALSNVDGPAASRGFILSAFGGTADRAIRAVMYKHFAKLAEEWPVDATGDGWDLG